ncbi:hypothetical protein Tco_1097220 [Tanacetum coccineum]
MWKNGEILKDLNHMFAHNEGIFTNGSEFKFKTLICAAPDVYDRMHQVLRVVNLSNTVKKFTNPRHMRSLASEAYNLVKKDKSSCYKDADETDAESADIDKGCFSDGKRAANKCGSFNVVLDLAQSYDLAFLTHLRLIGGMVEKNWKFLPAAIT